MSAGMAALLLNSACTSDSMLNDNSPRAITLVASTDNAGETRAAADIQGSSFYVDEVVNVYISDAATGSYVGGSPALYKTEEPSDNINPLTPLGEQPYFPNGAMDEVKINIRAMYPKSVMENDNPTESPTVSFNVKSNQTDSADYKASDLMFASVQNHGKGDGTAYLRFQHKMAKMVITATGEDGIRVKGIRLTNMKSTVNFNTQTGEVTATDNTQTDINIENGGAALVPPQQVSGIFITADVERDVNGGIESSTAAFNLQTPKTLQGGRCYYINLAIGIQNWNQTSNITSWPDNVGTISVAAAGSQGFYITGVTDKVFTRDTIKQDDIVIYTKREGDKPNYTYSNQLTENQDYVLQYFNNVNKGTASVLVLGAGSYTGLASVQSFEIRQSPCALKYPESTMTLDFAYDNVVNNPLKVLHGGTGGTEYDWRASDGTLTFEYDNTKVHVDDYGNVTMRGVGSTTIKATLNGDGNYQTASAQYTLTIQNKELKDPTTDPSSSISITMPASYEYTGSSLQTTFEAGGENGLVIKDGNGTLIRGTHYTLSYSGDLTNVGTVTVTITGKGDYTGTFTRTFQITQATPTLIFDETPVVLDVSHDNRSHVNSTFGTSQYLFDRSVTRTATASYGPNNTALTPTLSISGNTDLVSFTSGTGVVNASQVTNAQSATTDVYKNYQKGTVTVTATAGDGTNVKKVTKSYTITIVQTVWDFYFNGAASESAANSYITGITSATNVTIPGQIVSWQTRATGTYGLEAWGAQGGGYGGHSDRYGGVGGYTKGQTSLSDQTLYVVCGGGGRWKLVGSTPDPNRSNGNAGGYNGGGKGGSSGSYYHAGGGGGGATHIANVTGLLHDILDANNDNQMDTGASDKLYIVAGGGGGNSNSRTAGMGGGETAGFGTDFTAANTIGNVIPGGNNNATTYKGYSPGLGQDGAATFNTASGEPGNTPTATEAGQQNRGNGGGGGGYWGGYAKTSSNSAFTPHSASTYAAGGGGSGYVNTSVITNGSTSNGGGFEESPTATLSTSGTYPSPTGQGHARITLLTVPASVSAASARKR